MNEVEDRVIRDVKWYVRWRTTIWAIVWFIVGLFGGNADRIIEYIPTLKYSTTKIEQKLQEYNELKEKIEKLQNELDKLNSKSV